MLYAEPAYHFKSLLYPLGGYREDARSINDLLIYKNRLYIGYGDYSINTGPTDIFYYDFATKSCKAEFTADDEALENYCVVDSLLMVPGADATEDWSLGNIYIQKDNTWHKYRTIPKGLHVFDIEAYKGSLFCSTGSVFSINEENQPAVGVIYTSADTAKTWHLSYATPSDSYSVYRTHDLINFKGSLYAFAHSFYSTYKKDMPTKIQPLVPGDSLAMVNIMKSNPFGASDFLRFDGTFWNYVDVIQEKDIAYIKPILFKNTILFECFQAETAYALDGKQQLIKVLFYSFDGEKATKRELPFTKIIDSVYRNNKLYLLADIQNRQVVAEFTDLEHYKTYDIPSRLLPLSIEVQNNQLYIGSRDGNIYFTDMNQVVDDGDAKLLYPDSYRHQSTLPVNDNRLGMFVSARIAPASPVSYDISYQKGSFVINTDNIQKFQFFVPKEQYSNLKKITFLINKKSATCAYADSTNSYLITLNKNKVTIIPSSLIREKVSYKPTVIASINNTYASGSLALAQLGNKSMLASVKTDLAINTQGGYQADLKKGDITIEDVYAIHYVNYIVITKLTGKEIMDLMDYDSAHKKILFLDGKDSGILDPTRIYTVAMTDYLANNAQEYCNRKIDYTKTKILTSEAMVQYLINNKE